MIELDSLYKHYRKSNQVIHFCLLEDYLGKLFKIENKLAYLNENVRLPGSEKFLDFLSKNFNLCEEDLIGEHLQKYPHILYCGVEKIRKNHVISLLPGKGIPDSCLVPHHSVMLK
jgi:hypothetical protein